MCCIMGYAGRDLPKETFTEYLLRTTSRGPDDQRVAETEFGLLGFGRLAILGRTPEGILWREKAAFSDAVGHSMVDDLKEYAETVYTDRDFAEKCGKYTYARPFTKESLLYREIFEKYYPGQAEMIVDYWMPNKAWPHCDVNDPSARVLANYGASGQ